MMCVRKIIIATGFYALVCVTQEMFIAKYPRKIEIASFTLWEMNGCYERFQVWRKGKNL